MAPSWGPGLTWMRWSRGVPFLSPASPWEVGWWWLPRLVPWDLEVTGVRALGLGPRLCWLLSASGLSFCTGAVPGGRVWGRRGREELRLQGPGCPPALVWLPRPMWHGECALHLKATAKGAPRWLLVAEAKPQVPTSALPCGLVASRGRTCPCFPSAHLLLVIDCLISSLCERKQISSNLQQ